MADPSHPTRKRTGDQTKNGVSRSHRAMSPSPLSTCLCSPVRVSHCPSVRVHSVPTKDPSVGRPIRHSPKACDDRSEHRHAMVSPSRSSPMADGVDTHEPAGSDAPQVRAGLHASHSMRWDIWPTPPPALADAGRTSANASLTEQHVMGVQEAAAGRGGAELEDQDAEVLVHPRLLVRVAASGVLG